TEERALSVERVPSPAGFEFDFCLDRPGGLVHAESSQTKAADRSVPPTRPVLKCCHKVWAGRRHYENQRLFAIFSTCAMWFRSCPAIIFTICSTVSFPRSWCCP